MKLAIIGDIHGNSVALKKLLKNNELYNRKVIFLGDYINKGKDSKKVIELLIKFNLQHKNVVFLKGNHEFELEKYLQTGNFFNLILLGGIPMIRSYIKAPKGNLVEEFKKVFPKSHFDFISGLKSVFQNKEVFISHSGNYSGKSEIGSSLPGKRTISNKRIEICKTIICGHYCLQNNNPIIKDDFICIDTDSGSLNGKLTVLFYPERTFKQY